MIPFNKPYVPEVSKRYAIEALQSDHQQGDGPFTEKSSKLVSNLVGGGHVLLTPSCTHALEMASMLGNFGPGDEVILPSYTFTSAATAITQFGATPVFVDIDPLTKGIDANQVNDAVTNKTVAISWVNYAGVAPDIEALQSIAYSNNLLLIEDNAHGLGGAYKGKPLGSFGDFSTQSFHATKNIQCGEGGAIVINNDKYIEKAEIIREKGTNRKNFVKGKVSKYEWVDKGSSYLIAESLAAVLLGQLENFEDIQQKRSSLWNYYLEIFSGENGIRYTNMKIDNNTKNIAHMFFLEFTNFNELASFQNKFSKEGISCNMHYQPLATSPAGVRFGKFSQNLDISIKTASTLLRLPLYYGWSEHELNQIKETLNK